MLVELQKYFYDYYEYARGEISLLSENKQNNKSHIIHLRPTLLLQTSVEKIESNNRFKLLVEKTSSSFSKNRHGENKSSWSQAIKKVFRRGHFYTNIINKKEVDFLKAYKKYCDSFTQTQDQILYLAPLEYVHFDEDKLEFDQFTIQKYSQHQLNIIFNNDVNEIFFPWAVIDTTEIKDYWFLCYKETVESPKIGKINIDFSDIDRVHHKFSSFPKSLEPIIKILTIYDWQADFLNHKNKLQDDGNSAIGEGWCGFEIPFIIRLNNNMFSHPAISPSLEKLSREPFFNPQTGEELGEKPTIIFHYNQEETVKFYEDVKCFENQITNLNLKQWPFIGRALDFHIKAFFSEGLDQLLWHISVLEALVGEKGYGVTNKIAHRIAAILGKTKKQRTILKRKFKRLYEFRSTLVHGGQFKKNVYWGHLREGRDFAQQSITWFLSFLSSVEKELKDMKSSDLPKRETILSLLDIDPKERSKLHPLNRFLE